MDRLVTGDPTNWVSDDVPRDGRNALTPEAFVGQFPMSGEARSQLTVLFTASRDPLAQMSEEAAERYLVGTSYPQFLAEHWQVGPEALKFFRQRSSDFFGTSIDYVSAADALVAGFPGRGNEGAGGKASAAVGEPYIYHFPDGNASIARLLVHALVPAVATGVSRHRAMERIVSARFDYGQSDVSGQPTRIRLVSTVLAMRNGHGHVDVVYDRGRETGARARRLSDLYWLEHDAPAHLKGHSAGEGGVVLAER